MFYGWKIVGVTFITLFISVGFIFYSYSIFFGALLEEFESSRFGVSMGLAIMNVSMGAVAIFIGKAVDNYSIKKLMVSGAFLMSVGFLLAAQITELWQFYVILATFLGFGAAFIGMIPSQTLVSNWFIRKRGTALGISTMGVSASGMVMALVSAWLIEEIGWRYTFIVYGLITTGVLAPLIWIFAKNRPEDIGLYPDGESSPYALPPGTPLASEGAFETDDQKVSDTLEHHSWTIMQVITNVNFWAITITMSLNMHCIGAVLTHMNQLGLDFGLSTYQAAALLSLSAGVGVVGKVMFGWIADHTDTRRAVWLSTTLQFIGVLILMKSSTYLGMQIGVAFFGFGMGGVVPLWGSLIGEVFGRENFGSIMGIMTPCMLPIQVSGVPLAGYIYDQTGSYQNAFLLFLFVYAASILTLLMLKRQDVDQHIKRDLVSSSS